MMAVVQLYLVAVGVLLHHPFNFINIGQAISIRGLIAIRPDHLVMITGGLDLTGHRDGRKHPVHG